MTHDFAKKKKPPAAATRKKKTRKSQVPGWVWLFTGVVAGIFISFLSYLADITPERAPKAEKKAAAKHTKKPATDSATKFDFYTLLPEREVIVPDEPKAEGVGAPRENTVYILQAGSFRHAKDADRLRAQLILMGLDATVEAVTNDNGDQWFRVQVGPFADGSHMSKARNTLIKKGIDTLVMKKKKAG